MGSREGWRGDVSQALASLKALWRRAWWELLASGDLPKALLVLGTCGVLIAVGISFLAAGDVLGAVLTAGATVALCVTTAGSFRWVRIYLRAAFLSVWGIWVLRRARRDRSEG